jgi:hypothetical protein
MAMRITSVVPITVVTCRRPMADTEVLRPSALVGSDRAGYAIVAARSPSPQPRQDRDMVKQLPPIVRLG